MKTAFLPSRKVRGHNKRKINVNTRKINHPLFCHCNYKIYKTNLPTEDFSFRNW